jgi:hypothetical protein
MNCSASAVVLSNSREGTAFMSFGIDLRTVLQTRRVGRAVRNIGDGGDRHQTEPAKSGVTIVTLQRPLDHVERKFGDTSNVRLRLDGCLHSQAVQLSDEPRVMIPSGSP